MTRIKNNNLLKKYLDVETTTLDNIYEMSDILIKVIIPNSELETIYISPNIEKKLAFRRDEILNGKRPYVTLLPANEVKRYKEEINKFSSAKKINATDLSYYRLITGSNKSIYVKEKVSKIYDRKGNLVALFSEITNADKEISDKKFKDTIQILTKSLLGAETIEDFYPFITKIFSEIILVSNYYLVKIEDEKKLNFVLFYDEKDESPKTREFKRGLTEYIIRTKQAVFASKEDILKLNKLGEIDIIGEIPEYWAGIPIVVDGKVWGAIVMQRYGENVPFSDMEKNFLEFIADRIAFVIKIIATKEELIISENNSRTLAEVFDALHRISNITANSNRPEDEVFTEIIGLLQKVLGKQYWARIRSKNIDFSSPNYIKKNLLFAEKIETPGDKIFYLEAGKVDRKVPAFNENLLNLLSETVNKLKDYLFRRKSALVIKENEYKFRSIIQFASVAIIITDDKGRVVESNNFAAIIFGYDSNEFKNLSIFDILDFKNKQKPLISYLSEARDESELTNLEIKGIKKGGSYFFAEYSLGSWVSNNSRFFTFFISDISQRKYDEQLLKYKADFEKVISGISSLFLHEGLQNFSNAFQNSLKKVGEFFEASRASFFIISKEKHDLTCLYEWTSGNADSLIQKLKNIPLRKFSTLLNELTKKGVAVVNSENADKLEKVLLRARNARSAVVIASYVKGEFSGIILLEFADKKITLENEIIVLLQLLSEILSNSYMQFLQAEEREKTSLQMKKFIQAVEQSESSIVITDISGNIEYVNPAFEKISGYSKNEALGKNPRILKSGYTTEEEYKELWDMISSGKTWRGIFKNKRKDGSYYWESAIISPVKNKKGRIVNYIAIKEDITEKLQVENQLALMRKMEAIGELAAGIAHEINTPMQFIGDNTNFLKESFESIISFIKELNEKLAGNSEHKITELSGFIREKEEEYDFDFLMEEIPAAIEQTLEGIDRVSKIVKAVKEFSHEGAKEKVFADLNKSIESTVMISRNEWKYVAELELALDENLPPVKCVIDEINQVLLNITVNAAQAIAEKLGSRPEKKGKILITTEHDDKYATIKISDTGTGIPKENLDKIFDPFFTTKEVGKGTGQGLAIAHDIIVKKHKGILKVESTLGKGSAFIIKLPLENREDK